MPRGYRCIIVALVGWLVLAASPPDNRAERENRRTSHAEKSLSEIAATLKSANEPKAPDPGCERGKENRSSDLCAQWKAADAAEDSATWTRRTFWVAVGGVVIGGFTLVAAAFAAWYARQAATAAHSALENERARTAVELAPFVSPVRIYVQQPISVLDRPTICVELQNFGQTPAFSLKASFQTHAVPYPIQESVPMTAPKASFVGDLPQGGKQKIARKLRIAEPTFSRIGSKYALIIYLELEYTSRFATKPIRDAGLFISEGADWLAGTFRRMTHEDESAYKK